MRTTTLGFAIGALLIAGACKKKDQEAPKTGTGEATQKKGTDQATGEATGTAGDNSGSTATAENSGTSTATAASTQAGCVTKLPGAEMPQGDITLTAACGAVTIEGDVTIDAKLTIEPGVTISFVENAGLYMGYNAAASLIAKGTADKPSTATTSARCSSTS
jgi:hypothetical protein